MEAAGMGPFYHDQESNQTELGKQSEDTDHTWEEFGAKLVEQVDVDVIHPEFTEGEW
jgi:hypothetical protein